MVYGFPGKIINKHCSFHLGLLNFSLGEASRHIVRTCKQHRGETMSGGTNFRHELARCMNELRLEVGPPVSVRSSDDASFSVSESSAASPDTME